MADYQPAPNVASLVATYRQGTNLMTNTIHVLNDTGWDVAKLVALQELYKAWETSDGKAERSSSVELIHLTASDLTSADGAYSAMAVDPAIGGLFLDEALPLSVTLAVTAVSGTRGRGTQGRIFFIGLAEGAVESNVVSATTKDNILDDYNALLAAINLVAGQSMVVLHRYKNNVLLAEATSTPIVTFAVRDTVVDSQKNRLPNHRRASKRTLESLCAEVTARGGTCTFP